MDKEFMSEIEDQHSGHYDRSTDNGHKIREGLSDHKKN